MNIFKRAKNWVIKQLGGEVKTQKEEKAVVADGYSNNTGLEPYPDNHPMRETYLFDFKNYGSAYRGGNDTVRSMFARDLGHTVDAEAEEAQKPVKIKVKPVDVVDQLESAPTPFSMANLDDKIEMLKEKEKLITQHYAKREVTALIERLENRKKYSDHKEYFDQFQNTTEELIDKLLEKYELVMKTSDIFVPEFPDDAIAVMKSYTEKMAELCDKKPVFYVIAEEKDFRKAYEKRDPILLVQSPFGFYWQILGAWDEEMLILGEL